MTLPRVDPKDFAAAGELIQSSIGETNRVIVAPALAVFQATITDALDRLDAVAPGIASAVRTSLEGMGDKLGAAVAVDAPVAFAAITRAIMDVLTEYEFGVRKR